MPQTVETLQGSAGSPAESLAVHLQHDNEVIRCAALRAFAANAAEPAARRALLDALADPDPDIRSDALDRLAVLARPQDADELRASLTGDPVREVKIAAIEALGNLKDTAVIPLLRNLAGSRCEDTVAWEDEGGDWDDWLDIQVAAITALGRLQAEEAVEDLLAARRDEFGQDVDDAVFGALCYLGTPGVGVLLDIIRTENQRPARRAAAALAKSDIEALLPHLDDLLAAENPDIREIALGALGPTDDRAADLARHDPSASIRRNALRLIATARPGEVEAALHDSDESVQADALTLLDVKIAPEKHEALVDNLLLWLRHAGPALASSAAAALPLFAPNRCEGPLLDAIADADLPLEARVAAVRALAGRSPTTPTAAFAGILENPARQVRTAALAELSRRAELDDSAAVELLASAVRGELNAPAEQNAGAVPETGRDAHEAAMPKGESGPRRIRITRDGDIVEGEAAPQGSTLAQIISAETGHDRPDPLADDTPEEAPAKRRRRQPVEGPDDFAAQFQLDAIGVSVNACNRQIEDALLHCALHGPEDARRAAWTALSKWSPEFRHAKPAREAAMQAMQDPDPVIRNAAFGILAKDDLPADALRLALDHDDALLRAAAVLHLPPQAALDFLADEAPAVRQSSVVRVASAGNPALPKRATEILVQAERSDTLRDLFRRSQEALREGLAQVSATDEPRRVLVLLEALASLDRSGNPVGTHP